MERYWLEVTLRVAVHGEPREVAEQVGYLPELAAELAADLGPDCQVHGVRLVGERGEVVTG